MTPDKKKTPWMKRVLWSVFVLVVIAAGIYWYVASEKFADTDKVKADFTVNAIDFIREFQGNDSVANAKYKDKIVIVNGTVSAVEAADSASMNIKFIDTTTGSYAIFAFQEQHLAEAKTVKEGDIVSIKGSFSGGTYSEILGVEKIDFKRSALNKTK
ncbi:MAG: hypothetical protein E6Q24_08940 [Chitinophagaceae bacterium]|nr:MAG: hypothetical protein E6Q24_08940 [Chitinophagaceae bacterium]